jgi:putative OPT family oligopeptide transporter
MRHTTEQNNNTEPTEINEQSFIPASQSLPEITFKGVILAIFLTVILAAANAYLGLKVGTTISASIPAAVISMAILRLFKKSNILENNIVQTAASSGEALVAGIIYIIPALLVLNFWHEFNYWETVLVAVSGGALGVLFSVPLRRVLLAEKSLRFPEGVAIGNVLKANATGMRDIKHLIVGGIVGGLISFCQTGLEVISGSVQYWFRLDGAVVGIGSGFDAALFAAGYITGSSVAVAIFAGVLISWLLGIPYFSYTEHLIQNAPIDTAMFIWKSHLKYIGVGMMLVGGLWTLITFMKPMAKGIHASFKSLNNALHVDGVNQTPRTERDVPINYASWLVLVVCIPLAVMLWHYTSPDNFNISNGLRISTVVVGTAFAVIGGFIFSSICAYFTGLVGSTNNPLSGMTLCALIIISLILYAMLGEPMHLLGKMPDHQASLHAAAFAIIIGGVVAASAAISNDTIQDLKAGHMVGATPWKQQFMLIVGVFVAALVIPAILNLLFNAYGIAGVYPHPGMDPKQMLSAPQATLMAALVQGVFGHKLPWSYIELGFVLAVFSIIIDSIMKRNNKRFPVLAVALGVYLPLDASMPLVFGGFLSYLLEKRQLTHQQRQRGLILACGVVAGAALMGVILAVPFALEQSSDALKIVPDSFQNIGDILGIAVFIALAIWMYRVVVKKEKPTPQ